MKRIDKKYKKYIIILSILALVIRVVFINDKSGDYIGFLKVWVDEIRRLGYFKSLKYNIGDYNVPYIVILTFISLLKCRPLIPIKIVSIIFDYLCALYASKIVYKITNKTSLKYIAYIITLFIPTVIINGAMWAQCDSIYTFFILVSIYNLLNKKYINSFIFLGVSFAFKLQFIFILPLYVILYFREKDIKFYYFLLIPLVNIVMCLPAIIAGRNMSDVLLIYFNQTKTYSQGVLNFPNIYNYIQSNKIFFINNIKLISNIGILLTLFIFFIMWLYCIIKKVKFNNEKILLLGIWSIIICTYFLPHMHDRYMYVCDILSVIYVLSYFKKTYIAFGVNIISIITYFHFLFVINILDYRILSFIYFIIILIFTVQLFMELGDNNGYRKNKLE